MFTNGTVAMGKKKGGGGSGGGDKRDLFFSAIRSEKLDTIRYSLGPGGIPITAEDEDGHRSQPLSRMDGAELSWLLADRWR